MKLRERANKKANKVAGPDESDGMAVNNSQLDREDHCGREETGQAFLSQEMRGKCPEWLRKHSLRGEEKKGTANVNSGSWTKPGKGWRCRVVGSRAKGRGHPHPTPRAEPTGGKTQPSRGPEAPHLPHLPHSHPPAHTCCCLAGLAPVPSTFPRPGLKAQPALSPSHPRGPCQLLEVPTGRNKTL